MNVLHTVTKSQWVAAAVFCSNGAVAHTTPVYIVVNGKPTYSPEKAPQIIQKQQAFIEKIRQQEMAKTRIDFGILERLDKADIFYKTLLNEVQAAKLK